MSARMRAGSKDSWSVAQWVDSSAAEKVVAMDVLMVETSVVA